METITKTAPAVYVSTYHKYACGSLDGEWVALTDFASYEDFMDYLRELHGDEPDPEFMFQDFEGFSRELYCEHSLNEDTFNKIVACAELSEQYGEEAIEAYFDCFGSDADIEEFEDRYRGCYDSEEDFAEEDFREMHPELDDYILDLIDYERVAAEVFTEMHYENGHVFY